VQLECRLSNTTCHAVASFTAFTAFFDPNPCSTFSAGACASASSTPAAQFLELLRGINHDNHAPVSTSTAVRFLGDATSSLGDAKSSLGDAESSLGDAKSSLGDAESSLGDATSSLGDAKSSLGDAKSSLGDAKSSLLGDVRWLDCRRPREATRSNLTPWIRGTRRTTQHT
jgi:hypothetical protein